MNEILDEEEIQKKSKVFSWLAFISLLFALGLSAVLYQYFVEYEVQIGNNASPSIWLARSPIFFAVVGAVCSVLSFRKKEPATFIKWISAILNMLLLLFFLGVMLYARVIDSQF